MLFRSLFTILLRGQAGRAYNVGSEEAVSILELAERVAGVAASVRADGRQPAIEIAKQARPEVPSERYVPSCNAARAASGCKAWVSLNEAIARTMTFATAGRRTG